MKLGIGTYTYGWAFAGQPPSLTLAGLLDRACGLGAAVVQIADNAQPDQLSAAALADLRRRAADSGLELELGGRGLTQANLDRFIALTSLLGGRLLRFVIDAGDYRPELPDIISRLRTALPRLRDHGVTLALENHDRLRATEFAQIVQAVADPCVGICLDTVNSFGALEGPEVVVATLAPFTVNLHLKDFTIRRVPHQMGFVVEGTPAGEGRLDIPGTLAALASHNRCHTAILELWTPPAATVTETLRLEEQWAARSMANLRRLKRFETRQ